MSEVTFGLSPERIKQLLACAPEVGARPPADPNKPRSKNAIAVARWKKKKFGKRPRDLQKRRQQVREAVRRFREKQKTQSL